MPGAEVTQNQYAILKAIIRNAGLLETQGKYYTVKVTYTLALFAVGVALFFLLDGWARVFIVAPYLGFVFTQLAYLSHDLGHKQVFPSSRVNHWLGMFVANLIVGISLGWWNDKHNAHHANPNHDGMDPDIDIPFMVFSEEQAREKRGLARLIAGYQAFLFFPALTLTVYSMQYASILYVIRERFRFRAPDIALLLTHFALYYVGLLVLLGPWQALVFILLHRAILGVMLGAAFAPNHKGMMVIGPNDDKLDFLRKQVLTARSVRSTPFIDFMYGGLNHQAVHHLFPGMARNKLPQASIITKQFCEQYSVSYHQTGVRQSLTEILGSLHLTSKELRRNAA
jgi:fatty acid desaturase